MRSDATHWGVWLHAVRPVAELAELAASAEALGAAAVLVADEGTDRDLYVTLAGLALRTRRVLLMGAVTNPFSRHPVATAAAFASLAELAPGRIVAGFGTGGSRVLGPMGISPSRPFSALVECVDIVEALWRGDTVDRHGEFSPSSAALPWTPGPIPIAVASRGPRGERLGAERADWILLAGRATDTVAPLVGQLRAMGLAARGRAAAIAWNPTTAWTEPMRAELRMHFAYMAVDMPPAERSALGFDDDRTAHLREIVNSKGPEAAGELIPDTVLERYAVAGHRAQVVARLRELRRLVRPELLVFDAHDYSAAFLEEAASVAVDAGVLSYKGSYALDSQHRA
jgi:5,10-methylenetetrahydromethanopterin reductase